MDYNYQKKAIQNIKLGSTWVNLLILYPQSTGSIPSLPQGLTVKKQKRATRSISATHYPVYLS